MNPSANTTEHQGDPNWATENWDQPGSVGALDSGRSYTGHRLDWDWDNPMILAQHPGGGANDGDADRKSPISGAGLSSNLRSYSSILQPGYSSSFAQNPLGIFSSSGIRGFGAMDSSSTTSALHGALGSTGLSGIPGLAPTSGNHGDMRSPYDNRRRQYFGGMDLDQKGHSNDIHVKREDVCTSDGHGARIGLNLGVRTYFSTEDTAAGRLGKRHRANSPGSQVPMCQAEGCKADLSTAKHYHRRHKVCESHSKAANVIAAGHTQRFCQQCSRFHLLSEFDEGKRSCRKRLADHNRRRRKPQPTASTGGTTAESVALKADDQDNRTTASTDPKSMLMQLKKSGSPSSASLDDSDDKPGSGGNNLQLRSSSGFIRSEDRPSHTVMLSSQPNSSDAQALLSAMSLSPPVPLMLQSAKRQISILPAHQDAAVYQQFLHGVGGGHTGPNLSLSSLGGGLGLASQGQRSSSEQNFNPSVPWLRPMGSRSDLTPPANRPTMNLQHLMSEKNVQGSNHQVTSSGNTSSGQVFSPIQNLLPSIQSSRDISGSEWMLGSLAGQRDNSTPFGSSALNISGGQLEGHQMLALLEGPAIQEGTSGGGPQPRAPMEFLQQHANDGADGTRSGVTDLKFPDLQTLRSSSFGPSIYDSHHNILTQSGFSYSVV